MKKYKKVGIIIVICILCIFTIYKIDSSNRRKKQIVEFTNSLLDNMVAENYEMVKDNLRKQNGEALSDEELENFLLNTGLYRALLIDGNDIPYIYSAKVNFFNLNEGIISFSFKALNGDLISNTLKYKQEGADAFLIVNDVEKNNKVIKKYPIKIDLANGKNIESDNEISDETSLNIDAWSFVKDENNNIVLEVVEEAKEDIKIVMNNMMGEELESFKSANENYNMMFDKEGKEISLYYTTENKNELRIFTFELRAMLYAMVIQGMNENPDWHVTINYYDYKTKDLLESKIIR